jgi:hypothetical protein
MEYWSTGVLEKRRNNSGDAVEFNIPTLQNSITPIL